MSTAGRQAQTRRSTGTWAAPESAGLFRRRAANGRVRPSAGALGPRRLVPLDDDECWRLLRTDTVGRIVYTYQALPAVVPVNYAVLGEAVLLRTSPTSRLGQLEDGTVVAFEVDCIDRAERTGWSVVLVGATQVLGSVPEGMEDALALVGAPWGTSGESVTLRLAPGFVTGRELQRA